MSIPTGAYEVTYQVSYVDPDGLTTPSEVLTGFTGQLGNGASVDANLDVAYEAAADAMKTSIEAAYPSFTFTASRLYRCIQTGDTWPA